MVSVQTLQADDVLDQAAGKLRLWQTAKREVPANTRSTERSPFFSFGLERLFVVLSRVAMRGGRSDAARHFAKRACALNPHSANVQVALALALRRIGKDIEALPHLLYAAELDGGSRRGAWELARLFVRLEQEDAPLDVVVWYREKTLSALRAAACSKNTAIRAEASILLSNLRHDLGDHAGARVMAETAVSLTPHHTRAWRAKANALTARGDFANALLLYNRLLAREAENPELARRVKALPDLLQQASAVDANAIPENAAQPASVLIAVGGGIGDMLHTTPLIRNLAQRTGGPVDVLVAADHREANFLFCNSAFVSQVWSLCPAVLERRYKTVLLTHSFGTWRLPFQAEQVVISRTWRPFRRYLNETIFNLEAMRALLGVPYQREDATHYFVGEFVWQPRPHPLLGMHAGSKGGRWLSKRWPHFSELAARLKARGIAVASFGTPDEMWTARKTARADQLGR